MKRRISLIVTVLLAAFVILGAQLVASAEDTPTFLNSSLDLSGGITLKMECKVPNPTEGAYARITLPNGTVDESQLLSDAERNGDNYVFSVAIPAKDYAKDVKLCICDGDGNAILAQTTTSAKAYCEKYTELYENGLFSNLITALDKYAEASEYYFDASLNYENATDTDLSSVADMAISGTLPEGVVHRSATLLLESEITVRHYFEIADAERLASLSFFVDINKNGSQEDGEALTVKEKNGVYYVDIENVSPTEISTPSMLVVTDGASSYGCEYGALTYLKRVSAKTDSADTKNLINSLYNYSLAADALTVNVSFVTNCDQSLDSVSYKYGATAALPSGLAKSGSVLVGWYADEALTVRVNEMPSKPLDNLTLYAKWATAYIDEDFTDSTLNSNLQLNANGGTSALEFKDGVALFSSTGTDGGIRQGGGIIRDAKPNAITVKVTFGRYNDGEALANLYSTAFQLQDSNKKLLNLFTTTTTNKVRSHGDVKLMEITDGELVTLIFTVDFVNSTITYYDGSYKMLLTETLNLPSGSAGTTMLEFRDAMRNNNAPRWYSTDSVGGTIVVDEFIVFEGGIV